MNNISLFKAYFDQLDEVYKLNSTAAVLDSPAAIARQAANANEVIIPKMNLSGLADYKRGVGYAPGVVTVEEETVKFDYDRGRSFSIDSMDAQESAAKAGRASSNFVKTKVAPEMDAYRFAKIAGSASVTNKTEQTLTTANDAIAAINAGVTAVDEAEAPQEGRYLFITPTLLNLVNSLDSYKSKAALEGLTVIKVPQSRFYTKIDMLDGWASGEEDGGYKKSADGANINFMIVPKSAVLQITKHVVNKIIGPDVNQSFDGWLIFYRAYGLTAVYDNGAKGIYISHAPVG